VTSSFGFGQIRRLVDAVIEPGRYTFHLNIPPSYRWSVRGGTIMSMVLKFHYERYIEILLNQAV